MTLCLLNSLTIKLNYIQANITHSNSYMVLIPFLYAYKITLLELLSTLSTHFSSIHFNFSSVVVLSSCLVLSALMCSLGMLSCLGGLCLSLVLCRCLHFVFLPLSSCVRCLSLLCIVLSCLISTCPPHPHHHHRTCVLVLSSSSCCLLFCLSSSFCSLTPTVPFRSLWVANRKPKSRKKSWPQSLRWRRAHASMNRPLHSSRCWTTPMPSLLWYLQRRHYWPQQVKRQSLPPYRPPYLALRSGV